jgi:hypothetical protein
VNCLGATACTDKSTGALIIKGLDRDLHCIYRNIDKLLYIVSGLIKRRFLQKAIFDPFAHRRSLREITVVHD